MRVVQAVFGVFHHFELARELSRRGHLLKIYSTFPWRRLKREGLSRSVVETFPWVHTPEILLSRAGLENPWFFDLTGYVNALTFDEWTLRRIPECDAFIGISGAGLKTGKLVQRRGGKFICDRGSSHIRYRAELIAEEYARWGVPELAHEDPRDIEREETIYAMADALTVPSTYAARTYLERGVPAERLHVLPYGVLLDRFHKVADPPTDRFEVLYVGRVSLAKGVQYLLEAFARLPHPSKHLTVIGGVMPEMKAVLHRLPTDQVTFLGTVPQLQLKEYMSRSHVMVMPSLDEGLSLVMSQALACGCPVIGTNHTGAENLLTDGKDGFIVPVRETEPLTERLQQIADDVALQHRLSEQALLTVRNAGGWQQYGDGWESLLRELTGIAGQESRADGSKPGIAE